MGADFDVPVEVSSKEKFYWQKSEYAEEDEILRERWGNTDGPFNEVEGRGVKKSILSRKEQLEYLDCRDGLVDEKREIMDEVFCLDWKNSESVKKVAELLQKCIQLVNSQYDDDTDTELETFSRGFVRSNGSEKYILNELFVPILLEIQKNAFPEHIQKLNKGLMKVAIDNFDPESELYLQNKFVAEILKTTIETGGVEQVNIVANFVKENWKREGNNLDERVGSTYSEIDLEYTFSSQIEELHKAICEGVLLREWNVDQTTKVAKTLSETVGLNSWGCLGSYKKAFEHLGANESFPYLIENLRSEDVLTRRMSAEILYSLEVGEITIDNPEGVRYFDKLYMLVKEDDPDFFVRLYDKRAYVKRIDRNGKIGILSANHEILGFFQLDLESKPGKLKAEVKELMTKDIFLPKADESEDDKTLRTMMMEIFLTDYRETQQEIVKRTEIELNSLELHEQGWFVSFWSDKKTTDVQKEKVANLARKYGEVGIKAFLTLDYGESADSLIEFMDSETLEELDKETVLRNYAILLNRSFEWRKTFDVIEEGMDFEFSAEAHEAMIRKSTEFLRKAMLINVEDNRKGELKNLVEKMSALSSTLQTCRGLHGDSKNLLCTEVKPNLGSKSWILVDVATNSRMVVSVRTEKVYDERLKKFLPFRVNIQNDEPGKESVRIAFDLDDVRLSLDIGFGKLSKKVHPTLETKVALEGVEGTEGGHVSASFSPETSKNFPKVTRQLSDYMTKRFGDVTV